MQDRHGPFLLGFADGENVPLRSRGVSISAWPNSPWTVFFDLPLRLRGAFTLRYQGGRVLGRQYGVTNDGSS